MENFFLIFQAIHGICYFRPLSNPEDLARESYAPILSTISQQWQIWIKFNNVKTLHFSLILRQQNHLFTYQISIIHFGMQNSNKSLYVNSTYTYQIVNMQFGMYFTDVLTAKVPFYTYNEK